jgi:hypothetical protein
MRIHIEWLVFCAPTPRRSWAYRTRGCRRRAWLLATLPVFTAGVAAQQHAPNEHELRSMYCVEVIRADIELQHHLISASDEAANNAATPELRQQWINTSSELLQELARLEATLYRLQTYMLPRIQTLDSSALVSAIRQGDADSQACSASCSDNALLNSVNACKNPAWLPSVAAAP